MPDHVLLRQTMDDCLHEAMDVDSLLGGPGPRRGRAISGFHARDTTEPSPMAHEIVNGKPYTYLDDAPLEERRTRAVITAPLAAARRHATSVSSTSRPSSGVA